MNKYIINGKFMSDRMQGIVRYSREIVDALDGLSDDDAEVVIAIPPDAKDIPNYKNIRVEQVGTKTGIKWEQTDLRRYVKQNKEAICINLCNVTTFGIQPGITTIHDIMYKVNPSHYTTLRNKISRLWHCIQYKYICSHESVVLTDSNYSKKEIEKYYPKAKGKIRVIPCGWQHVLQYSESDDWQQRYPFLEDKQYYFSLSTLAKNKNGQWIINAAKRNPEGTFAIAGKYYETEDVEIPPNVHMLGFVSDEDACALIKHCKAFIHPSFYEGFGLPPLEALALGAEVISSNTTSLPEVLGDAVHYIDPNNADVDLEKLLAEPVGDKTKALERYSWQKSAEMLKDVMNKY